MAKLALTVVMLLCLHAGTAATVTKSADAGDTLTSRQRFHARMSAVAKSSATTMEFKHRLRVCNAYPGSVPVDIFHGKHKLTDTPLEYKSCREFTPPVRAGDKLQFKMAESNAGSFAVSDLPNNDAVLVLVIYRHDTMSTAVAFESHVFANLINAQVAVLDTYKGHAKAALRIQDDSSAKTSRSEELRYDSVVALNPGIFEVAMQGEDGELKARQQFVALNREATSSSDQRASRRLPRQAQALRDAPGIQNLSGIYAAAQSSDKLQFKMARLSAGSFAVSDLPNNDALLVLVIYRHDTMSTAVAFQSHVFANLINAQVAVLDTYKGHAKAALHVQDETGAQASRSEQLRFDSVVALNPGLFEVAMQGADGEMKARQRLVALNRESYVVIRCGVEAEEGE
eukprot:CAMPEP_0115204474 /NCGR_PEP_ID=MMETSP0270-20121206/19187_1 /TAXON_ID=71861 /ORGANISM="Scrippsiella trochoidea, Strain CCMP3099" /LENGTH=398 /DNA_ID=CAMNT_0002617973 /DNA_START=102 /DNA_END=1297 /DNA_ORIENTATION=-